MSVATEVSPVKGLVFRHATLRKEYHFGEGEAPLRVLRVTAVQKGVVHCKDENYTRVRIPLARFAAAVGEVLETPAAPVRLTAAEFEALHRKAHAAGHAAATAARPTPMIVQQHANALDDTSEVVQQWYESEGTCGFAWVLTPGDTPFARWARKQGLFRSSMTGGTMLWVRGYGQSLERKAAYAGAYAAVLTEAGIKAFGQSRMD